MPTARERAFDGLTGSEKETAPIDISGLAHSLTDIQSQIASLCSRLKEKGKSLALWGASHQGFTLAATTVLQDHAKYIIDSAPFKQGKFAPVSHLLIAGPDYWYKESADVILIAAPGYTEEIAGIIRSRYGTRVKILALRSNKLEELS